jgi:hypothetical protein
VFFTEYITLVNSTMKALVDFTPRPLFATLALPVAACCACGVKDTAQEHGALLSGHQTDARRRADVFHFRRRVDCLSGRPPASGSVFSVTFSAHATASRAFFGRLSRKNSPAQGNKFPYAGRFFPLRGGLFRNTRGDFSAHAGGFFGEIKTGKRKACLSAFPMRLQLRIVQSLSLTRIKSIIF